MTLGEHLEELRWRIIRSLIVLGVVVVPMWFASTPILNALTKPVMRALSAAGYQSTAMQSTTLTMPFQLRLSITLIAALFVAGPWFLVEMWRFVSAGLYAREKRVVRVYAPISVALFLAGGVFAYFVLLRYGLAFLLSMGANIDHLEPHLIIEPTIFFLLRVALGVAVAFQLPMVMMFVVRSGIVSADRFRRSRRYAIVFAFMLAAVLTPPDVATQLILAGPLIALYEFGILMGSVGGKGRDRSLEGRQE